jgi:hypothetical protein
MADAKISALTELTGGSVTTADDVLPIVDTSVTTTKKITVDGLKTAMGVQAASTTASGMVELLIQSEYDAGTDSTRVPTASLNRIALAAEQATTSGTEKDFTSIPSGTRRITVMFNGLSTNGTSQIIVQLGDSGGVETSGYTSAAYSQGGGSGTTSTAGFAVATPTGVAAAFYGSLIMTLQDSSDNTWVYQSIVHDTNSNNNYMGAGVKALSATLDRVRVTSASADTMDAGAVSIAYER